MGLTFDPAAVALPQGHFIDGAFIATAGSTEIQLFRPSDGIAFAACPIAGPETVDRAMQSAARARISSGWSKVRPRERVKVLHAWADLIDAHAEPLARIEALSSTRPITQVREVDIPMATEQIRFFAEMADKEGGALVPTAEDQMGMILTEPYGVVAAIAPWNFPLIMAAWKLGPALAAGNAVVIKPSEMTPHSTLFIADLAVRAGLPPGVLNVVLGDGATTGVAMAGHPLAAKISFTGSTRAGRAIMGNVAQNGIKPMTLELGGKSPQVVFADADIELAANCIARNIMGNAGQVCVAGSRLIVARSVAEDLVGQLQTRMSGALAHPTWDETSTYSPIISTLQIGRIDDIVTRTRTVGGECLIGGGKMDCAGSYYQPTLIAGVDPASPAVREEIFGPVLTIQTFDNGEDEALSLAAHPEYGLAAGVFTRDLGRALRMTQALPAGTLWVNRYGRSWDHILPTGGFGNSGLGKDLGRAAYRANRREKSVLIDIGAS
ncbi:aldehyde dehydrogenase family protein [Paracoccus aestuariivivens]|uniref:Aldehyde dehydrogenase family protein n=1 Tax=Paracoccus aestuariivivens TaxID=1820333 RepID=A0A6L6JJI4_9RHOB|nr:aldehyde dehydrogenase family protein [Paracoccus aestuariivivens]MTH80001.1 aldehyde dehydrogenase family protein [Paracoccus aestuariivivens]